MSMLPRLQPRRFYDLVIEVAIVRPGPIQGGMVHPYLNRRLKIEPETYPSEALKAALGRTLGVPIFQEQVMQVCMIAAGFSPGEADGLRRAMAAWKRKGGLEKYRVRILQGMQERGYEEAFAEQIYEQIKGFSDYGFPESHAASFALLAYASAWMKCHEPAAFLVALLNAQPMGFYSPDQLVRDARRHGLLVHPVDVCESQVGSHLALQAPPQDWVRVPLPLPPEPCREHPLFSKEGLTHPQPPLRLGLHLIRGLPLQAMARIVQAREEAPFQNAEDLALRAALSREEMVLLAQADALASLSGHRRQQVWEAAALHAPPALLQDAPVDEEFLELEQACEGEEIVFDYAAVGLTLRSHPMALLRPWLIGRKLQSSADLHDLPDGRLVRTCGIVITRQQPGTAKGVTFLSLEDEHGSVQVIVWKKVRLQFRAELLHARLLGVWGIWQREAGVCHLIAHRLVDLSPWLGRLPTRSRDFH
jgi:error-prone DNA polymerase